MLRCSRSDSETRESVLGLITACPGITKTELCKLTGLGWGTIFHHVRVLSRSGAIRHHLSSRRVFLYSSAQGGSQLMHMRLLRDEVPTLILAHVQAKPRSGIQDISRALRLSRKVVRRHVSELVDAGLVNRSDHYRPRFEVAMPWLSLGTRSSIPRVPGPVDEPGTNVPPLQESPAALGRP